MKMFLWACMGGGSEPDSGMDAGVCEYTGSGDHHGGKHGDGGSE